MPTFQVAWNPTTRVAKIQKDGATPGAGFTDIGAFDHIDDADDNLGVDENHVFYHHVRDLLYKATPSVQNMQDLQITMVYVTGVTVSPAGPVALANGATQQLTPTVAPADAANTDVTYESSNPDVATVSASGLVTAHATNDGSATITVTTKDGGFKDTVVINVA